MSAKCKKCGRPLRDPVSIARGMGAKCAGLVGGGKRFRARLRLSSGVAYSAVGDKQASKSTFSGERTPGPGPANLWAVPLRPGESGSISSAVGLDCGPCPVLFPTPETKPYKRRKLIKQLRCSALSYA